MVHRIGLPHSGTRWLASDRYLGTRRAVAIGGLVLSAGYFTLALGRNWSFFTGLGLIVLGAGFFKPNGYTMVGQLYGAADPRRDPGFTIYYMAINLGALFGPLICAWLAADPRYGWSYGFAASGTAMLIGLFFYLWARRFWLQGIGLPPARQREHGRHPAPLTPAERGRILAVAVITVFVILFWLAFEQVGSSLNVFAAHRTDRSLGGWSGWVLPDREIPAAWFQAINPFFILLLAPLMAGLWRRLGSRAPSTPGKMALGLTLLGLAYVVMVVGATYGQGGGLVSPWFLVAFYFVLSCGELCFLPVGISFVSQTAPARLASMLMGVWLTANFFASLIGGYVAGMVQRIERGEIFTVLAGSLLGLLVPTLRQLMGDPSARMPETR